MAFTFNLAQHSSRYDGGNLRDGFRKTASYCTVAAFTEMGNDERGATLKDEANQSGWGYWRPDQWGPDECALVFKKATWVLEDKAVKQLTDIRWTGDDDQENRPLFANAALLRHQSAGKRLLYSYAHMPSHVFTCSDGWYDNSKAKAYKDGCPTWASWLQSLDKQWPQTAIVASADWNMDMACEAARKYLESVFPDNWKVAGKNESGTAWPDTHDDRTLDWFVLGGAVSKTDPIVSYAMPDSDHKTAVGKFTA